MCYDPPENTVKPGFEIEPISEPEPTPHDPMDAHWQAMIAELEEVERSISFRKRVEEDLQTEQLRLEAERDKLKKACTAFECAANAYRAERDNLKERVSELEGALEKIADCDDRDFLANRIARAALSRTSEETSERV
jgi:predicted ribosome quality control (RQC) complex YloA/Tae2 family protein